MKITYFILGLLLVSFANADGLKKVNYADKTADSQSNGINSLSGSGLTPEQSKKLLHDIELIKQKQIEAQKLLDELDKDE